MKGPRRGVALAAPLLVALWSPLPAQEIAWTATFEYARGTYFFTEPSTTLMLLTGLDVRVGPLRLGASVPFLLQDNTAVARVGSTALPTGGERHGELRGRGDGQGMGGSGSAADPIEVETGSLDLFVADPLVSAGLNIEPGGAAVGAVHISVAAKPPFRDEASGIGTGAWDAGAGVGVTLTPGRLLVSADAMLWTFGDLPDLELGPALAYGLAVGSLVGDGPLGWTVSLFGTTEIVDGVDPPISVGGDVLVTSSSGRGLRLGARAGLTESAPDIAVSLGWRLPIAGGRSSP